MKQNQNIVMIDSKPIYLHKVLQLNEANNGNLLISNLNTYKQNNNVGILI